jgi:hypothetical protein
MNHRSISTAPLSYDRTNAAAAEESVRARLFLVIAFDRPGIIVRRSVTRPADTEAMP